MSVRIYPGGERRQIGEKQWEVEWFTIKKGADMENFDPDSDTICEVAFFPHEQHEQARKFADSIDKRPIAFGVVTVQEQIVSDDDMPHGIGEWIHIGETEEFI